MVILTLLLIAFTLSLDAFAVAITCGIKLPYFNWEKFIKIAFFFALFQGVLPLGGWVGGHFLREWIGELANWLTAAIFFILGMKTLLDLKDSGQLSCTRCQCKNWKCLLTLSFVTALDACMLGVTIQLKHYPLLLSLSLFALVGFIMALVGILVGHYSVAYMQKKSKVFAGFLLLAMAGVAIY